MTNPTIENIEVNEPVLVTKSKEETPIN